LSSIENRTDAPETKVDVHLQSIPGTKISIEVTGVREGWYNVYNFFNNSLIVKVTSFSILEITLLNSVIELGNGTRYIFEEWEINGKTISNLPRISIKVNKSKTIVLKWRRQYQLKFSHINDLRYDEYYEYVNEGEKTKIDAWMGFWWGWGNGIRYEKSPDGRLMVRDKIIIRPIYNLGRNNYEEKPGNIYSFSVKVYEPIEIIGVWREATFHEYLLITGLCYYLFPLTFLSIMLTLIVCKKIIRRKYIKRPRRAETKIHIYLEKLDKLYREGKISKKVYTKLKAEYEKKIKEKSKSK